MLLSRYVVLDIAHMRTASVLCVCVQSNLCGMTAHSSCSQTLKLMPDIAYQACIHWAYSAMVRIR